MRRILADIEVAPTIMSVEEELLFVARIMALSDEALVAEADSLLAILDRLQESHTGGAVFEVSEETRPKFIAFADRLRILSSLMDSPHGAEVLRQIADDLSVVFPDQYKERSK